MDVLDGIASIRNTFLALGMNPPTAILLGSHDDGMRLLSEVRQMNSWTAPVGSPELGKAVLHSDGSSWMELKIMEIAVRWPANTHALPDGKWGFA